MNEAQRSPEESANRMRVSFVLPDAGLAGGIRVISTHAHLLQRMGHEVHLFSTWKPKQPFKSWVRDLIRGDLLLRRVSHLDGATVDHRIVRHTEIRDRDLPDADIVVATWWETAEWVARLSPCKGRKVYFIQGYELHPGLPVQRLNATWRLPMRKIVVEQRLQELARTKFGDSTAILVPNAVDPTVFSAPQRGKQTIPRVGLLYAPEPAKGVDNALRAYEIARRKVPSLQLTAFGAVRPRPHLKPPRGTAFRLRPPQDLIPAIYASCDAWLYASRSDGFGLPILEAMACGTPVIATPAGAAPTLVPVSGGILVPHEDPDAMATAITQIVRMSDSEWITRSRVAVEVATRHTWEDATRSLEAAFREILLGSHPPDALPASR